MKFKTVATQYIVIMIIVEFNFKSKFLAGFIMFMVIYFGKFKFDVTRALSIFTLFFISQWFPVFIYIFKNILDTLSCSRVLNFLQIIIVFSFCFIIVRIGQITKLVKKLVSVLN